MVSTLYPPHDLPENENGWTFFERLKTAETLATNELTELQSAHLEHVVTHHARHTIHFAQRLEVNGLKPADITDPKNLARLPILGRAEIQTAGPALYSAIVPFDHLPTRESRTSGSTGQPVVVRRTRINSFLNEAATLRDHAWWARPLNGGRITMIRPQFNVVREVPSSPGNSINIAQQIPITTDIAEQARLISEFQPQVLLVYPNNLAGLIKIWSSQGGAPKSLRHLKTIGETVTPTLRVRVLEVLGLKVEDSYSSEEMGMMALQCPISDEYHTMDESHIIEVVREDESACAPGETGRLVVTDLHNVATPMIRYAIGDWAEVGKPCPCGRNLKTLKRILGRERNLVKLPNGKRHWPLIGFQKFSEVAAVRQYQVIQESFTEVELRVVLDHALQPGQKTAITEIVRNALGYPFRIRVSEHRERLSLGANGKFEEFICKVME